MEVHHHSHLASGETHTPRKKWTHYSWEFLMLFLSNLCVLKKFDWVNRVRLMTRTLTSARDLILSLKERYHLE